MYFRTDQFYRSNIIGICIQPIGLNNFNALLSSIVSPTSAAFKEILISKVHEKVGIV